MLQSLREETEGKHLMLLSPRKKGLISLFKEVRVFKGFACEALRSGQSERCGKARARCEDLRHMHWVHQSEQHSVLRLGFWEGDIFNFFLLGEGEGESEAAGEEGGGGSFFYWKSQEGGGGFQERERVPGGLFGANWGIWGGGGGLNIFFRGRNPEPIFGKGMRRSTFQWKKGAFSEKGEAIQWRGGLVRISTGKAIQWRGPGHSVNRRALKSEKFLSRTSFHIFA